MRLALGLPLQRSTLSVSVSELDGALDGVAGDGSGGLVRLTGIGICRFEGQLVAGDFSVLEFNGPIVRYELASNLAFLRCDIEGGLNRVAVRCLQDPFPFASRIDVFRLPLSIPLEFGVKLNHENRSLDPILGEHAGVLHRELVLFKFWCDRKRDFVALEQSLVDGRFLSSDFRADVSGDFFALSFHLHAGLEGVAVRCLDGPRPFPVDTGGLHGVAEEDEVNEK